MDDLAVNDRDAVALFKPKAGSKNKDGESGPAFQGVLKEVTSALAGARGPAHGSHDEDSLHSMFGNGNQEPEPRGSESARDDARGGGGADYDEPAGHDDRRPRKDADSGADHPHAPSGGTEAHERGGGDTADRSETGAKMAKNAEKSGGSGGDAAGEDGGRSRNSGGGGEDAQAAAAAAAAQGQGRTVPGAADAAAGQVRQGAQTQTAEGQGQNAAQNTGPGGPAQPKAGDSGEGGARNRRQAQEQDIAAKLKPGQAVKVEVKTSDESKTLISKPAQTLLTEGAGEAAAQTQRAGGPGAQGGPTIAQQAQQAQTQAQQQAQNTPQNSGPAQQIQIQTAALQTAAKGPAASGPAASGPAAGAAAGGESAGQTPVQSAQPRSETPQQAEQARQNAGAQNAHQTRARAVEQISVQIAKAAAGGNDRIQVTLKPAELGRVEIQIEMTHDGRAAAVVTADSKETLEMLRRDAAELAKALQEAGLKTGAGDLSFNLRGENAHADAGGDSGGGLFDGEAEGEDEDGGGDVFAGGEMPLPEDARLPQPVGVRGLAGVNLTA